MGHLPTIVSDLALILITAGAVTILFKWLRQPVVLGYIVAGFLISPHFVLLPSVADTHNVTVWADIGVIFLLFALGLEFSFRKLVKVGGTATIATVINMGSMIAIGYIVGQMLGWSAIECIFLGGMLSMSSTTIIIKAFTDMGLRRTRFANIVFGMLIVEDLAAILMMVLLSTMAVSMNFEGTDLLLSALKLIFFMVTWFVLGIALIPTMLKKLKRFLSDETLLIVAVGLCLGMVILADAVGFSAALGAFVMGSILAESLESKRIEHLVEPLKNLFGAIFFVSVGMMIVPGIIVQYIVPVLILTGVVLVGRVVFATIGVLASGQGLKVSVRSGFSLAQIGEFSFIIATLGMQLGVISDFLYPVIVAVSVVTTFTTPYFIKVSEPFADWLVRVTPARWNVLITGYAPDDRRGAKNREWKRLRNAVLTSVLISLTLGIGVSMLCIRFLIPLITQNVPGIWGRILAAALTIGLMVPFMNFIMRGGSDREVIRRLWNDNHVNKARLITLVLLRWSAAIALVASVLIPLFPVATGWIIAISVCVIIITILHEGFGHGAHLLEIHLRENLRRKSRQEQDEREKPPARSDQTKPPPQ